MEVLDNFSLNKPYRFCIYLASIILVSSFLTEPSGIDVSVLRSKCIWFIVLGLIAWIFDNYFYIRYLDDLDGGAVDLAMAGHDYDIIKLGINAMYVFFGVILILI